MAQAIRGSGGTPEPSAGFSRKSRIAIGFLTITMALLLFAARPNESVQSKQYDRWLSEEVNHIISDSERQLFLQLNSTEKKELFIKSFWKAHDPTPLTEENEFRDEFYRRLQSVNTRFSTATKTGSQTERGMIYLLLGQPVETITFRSPQLVSEVEAWLYPPSRTCSIGYNFFVMFFKPKGKTDYSLYCPGREQPYQLLANPLSQPERKRNEEALKVLFKIDQLLGQLSLSLLPIEHRPIMPNNSVEIRRALTRINQSGRKLIEALLASRNNHQKEKIESIYSIQAGNEDVAVDYRRDSSRIPYRFDVLRDDSGRPGLYFTFQLESSHFTMRDYYGLCYALLRVRIEAVDGAGRLAASKEEFVSATYSPWEIYNGGSEQLVYEGKLAIDPGTYQVKAIVSDPIGRRSFEFEERTSIPRTPSRVMQMSKPTLLLHSVRSRESNNDTKPFTFAGIEYHPAADAKLRRGQKTEVYFQLYYPRRDRVSSVRVRFRILSAGRSFWRNEEVLNIGQIRPGGFFSRSIELPTDTLPPGNYTLQISASSLSPPEANNELDFVVSDERSGQPAPILASVTR